MMWHFYLADFFGQRFEYLLCFIGSLSAGADSTLVQFIFIGLYPHYLFKLLYQINYRYK